MSSAVDSEHLITNARQISFGILTVSDTCSRNPSLDQSGPTAVKLIGEQGYQVIFTDCVPDERDSIRDVVFRWIDSGLVDVVLTTGGTGLAERDVTSDTILQLIEPHRRLMGLEHALYAESLNHTPKAALSRMVVGVHRRVLVISLPGSPKAVVQCLPIIFLNVEHAVALLKGCPSLAYQRPNVHRASHNCIADRTRQSPFPMISVEEAQQKMFELASTIPQKVEAVFYKNCIGRVLGVSLQPRLAVPPYDSSRMDGYAVKFPLQARILQVSSSLCAGDVAPQNTYLCEDSCVRISTGGPLPDGTDAIVPVENTRLVKKRCPAIGDPRNEEEDLIEISVPPRCKGEFVRPMGSDLPLSYMFKKGLRLGPTEVALLSMAGLLTPTSDICNREDLSETAFSKVSCSSVQGGYIPCIKQPKIGLLSTGNEIIDCSASFDRKHSVVDGNRPLLLLLLRKHGYNHVIDFGIVEDNEASLEHNFHGACSSCDIVITTGGVSMGERDLVASTLIDKFNATFHFHRVFMKPGKPIKVASVTYTTSHGSQKTVIFFCLPGNPVSAFVCAHLFILPFLRKLELRPECEWNLPVIHARLSRPISLGDRPEYLRALLKWDRLDAPSPTENVAIPVAMVDHLGDQVSSRLASCSDANSLLVLPVATETCKELPVNTVVNAIFLGD